jgi:electron transport complex protein RnfG
MGKILQLAFILAVFCIISAGSLAFIYMFTQPKIDLNRKLSYDLSVKEVLPQPGKAVSVSPRGYSGPINMLIGIDKSGKIVGIKILSQTETPGLGANVVKPKFLNQFIGKTGNDPIEPRKDIDAITGATISSRAVCSGVKQALEKAREAK